MGAIHKTTAQITKQGHARFMTACPLALPKGYELHWGCSREPRIPHSSLPATPADTLVTLSARRPSLSGLPRSGFRRNGEPMPADWQDRKLNYSYYINWARTTQRQLGIGVQPKFVGQMS